jgi:hypothetical protein
MKARPVFILFALLIIIMFSSCSVIPPLSGYPSSKINTGPGPEDLVLDTSAGYARLLVSCNARRTGQPYLGEIFEVNTGDDRSFPLKRTGEPGSLAFNPHGISITNNAEGTFLYVISHNDVTRKHYIVKYKVLHGELKFDGIFTHPLLVSPNALTANPDGSFWVSNDAGKRGSKMEMLFKLKHSKVIYYDGNGNWSVAADRLSFGNGIVTKGKTAYVATTRQNKLFSFTIKADGKLVNRKTIAKITGQDNLRFYGNSILVAVHPKPMAFVRHVKSSLKKSPSVIYRISPDDFSKEVVFADDGSAISAGSTGLIVGGYLYIAQVFEPFLLKVRLPADK